MSWVQFLQESGGYVYYRVVPSVLTSSTPGALELIAVSGFTNKGFSLTSPLQ